MINIKAFWPSLLIFVSFWNLSLAQPLQTGDRVPPYIFKKLLNDIGRKQHPPKLIILDFWSTGCAVCVAAFPKIEALQNQFGDDIQIVLTNNSEDKSRVKIWNEKVNEWRKDNNLTPIVMPSLPLIFKDSLLSTLFPYVAVPHHVWISNEGYVVGITAGNNTNEQAIATYLKNEGIQLKEKNDYVNTELERPLFLDRWIDASQVEQYSILIKGKLGNFSRPQRNMPNRFSVIRKSPHILYTTAAGKIIPSLKYGRTIIDVENPTVYYAYDSLQSRRLADYWYIYDLIVPESVSDSLYHYAITDLNRYLNYYGRIEKRVRPCFVIKNSSNPNLLKTAGAKSINTLSVSDPEKSGGQRYINGEWNYFLNWVSALLSKENKERAIVDESKVHGKIDLVFDEPVFNLSTLREQLKKHGLDIIESDREIEVFVLSDKTKKQ